MLRRAFRSIAIVATLFVASGVDAQRFKFDRYTADSGLASSFVLQIRQDAAGNLWFVTLDGLTRFDGREFRSFGTADGMADRRTASLGTMQDGSWVIGTNTGISIWDGRIVRNLDPKDGLGAGTVWAIVTDRHGRTWLGTQEGGLSVLEGDTIRTYTTDDGLPSNFIYALEVDSKDRLWIGTRGAGMALAEIGDDGVPDILRVWNAADGLTLPIVRSFLEEPEGTMLVGTRGGGMFRVTEEGSLQRVAPQFPRGDVYALAQTGSGGVLAGLFGEGVRVCAPPLYDRCLSLSSTNGLSSNAVTAVMEDREGGLWIGTTSGVEHLAGHEFLNYGVEEGLSSDFAFAVVPDRDDTLWVSSLSGLTRLELGTPDRPLRATTFGPEDGLPTREVWHVLRDREDRIWIATANGLCLFDERRGCRTFGVEHGLPSAQVLVLQEDVEGRIWIGTRNGVARLARDVRPDTSRITDLVALEGTEVFSIEPGRDGSLWLTAPDLLARYLEGEWKSWHVGPELGARTVTDLLVLRTGSVWVGTNDEGIGRVDVDAIDSGRPILELFGKESGLPSLSIKALLEADDGRIWAGSTAGLLELDPSNAGTSAFVVRQFTLDDGLASQEPTSQHAFARTSDGDLWFGFSGGLTRYVNVAAMRKETETVEPGVSITSIHAGDERVFAAPFTTMAASNGHSAGGRVAAPLGERDVTIAYGAPVFRRRGSLQYQVRLEGYEPNWSSPSSRAMKEYTQLPPGDYTLRVRARVGGGAWGPEADAPITIPALFWETIWFRGILVLVAVAVLFTTHKVRTMRMRRRNDELRALVAERTRALEERTHELEETNIELEHANIELDTINRLLKDADVAKSRFLARMSHELRTPLNSIIGFTDIMMSDTREMPPEKRHRFLRNVKHSATILLGLINDILDISKIEAGRMEVHVERVDIGAVVEEVVETMRVSADQRRSTITFEVGDDLREVHVDVVKVRQILQNLISNSVKYSDEGARIGVAVSRVPVERAGLGLEAFEIAVTDDGRGIPPDKLPGIFDEYRQAHGNQSSSSGTGLGLAIVSKFSELQGGRVAAESELGKGSTFRVWLPVDARNWDSEKRVTSSDFPSS